MMTKMEKLFKLSSNVFTVQDLSVIWGVEDKKKLWSLIRYYLRSKKLTRVYKGVYTIGEYDDIELAQKLVTPSYLSFYTALSIHGLIFQYYETVHSMSLISKKITVKDKLYKYHQLKESVFDNSLGVESKGGMFVAGPERSICDSLYLVPRLGIDNLKSVDLDKLYKISKIYNNLRLEKEVENIIKVCKK